MGRVAFGCEEVGSHKFPPYPKLRKKWERALRRVNFKASDYSRFCSKHFKETDFETISKETGFPLQRKFLKKSALPTIFSWNSTGDPGTSARTDRLERRNAKRCLLPPSFELSTQLNESLLDNTAGRDTLSDLGYIHEVEISNVSEEENQNESAGSSSKVLVENVTQSTQTSTFCRMFLLEDLLIDDEAVHFYTGLESNEKFNLVLSTLCPMAYNLKYRSFARRTS